MLIISRRLLSPSCCDLIECLFELVPSRLAASFLKLLYQVPKIISTFVLVRFNFLFGKFQSLVICLPFVRFRQMTWQLTSFVKTSAADSGVPMLSADVMKTWTTRKNNEVVHEFQKNNFKPNKHLKFSPGDCALLCPQSLTSQKIT